MSGERVQESGQEHANQPEHVRSGRDFHYIPRLALNKIREHPVSSVGVAIAVAGIVTYHFVNINLGFPIVSTGALVEAVGLRLKR